MQRYILLSLVLVHLEALVTHRLSWWFLHSFILSLPPGKDDWFIKDTVVLCKVSIGNIITVCTVYNLNWLILNTECRAIERLLIGNCHLSLFFFLFLTYYWKGSILSCKKAQAGFICVVSSQWIMASEADWWWLGVFCSRNTVKVFCSYSGPSKRT